MALAAPTWPKINTEVTQLVPVPAPARPAGRHKTGRAVARPIPSLPPVTKTVRPAIGPLWICPISVLLRWASGLVPAAAFERHWSQRRRKKIFFFFFFFFFFRLTRRG